MKKAMKNWTERYVRHMTHMGRARALAHLLMQSDRHLADAGFSRELFNQGVNAWPWKSDDTQPQTLARSAQSSTAKKNPDNSVCEVLNLDRLSNLQMAETSGSTQTESAELPTRQSAA